MNETNCENILTAKMAELDGEETEISVEAINLHLSVCENCRMEFEEMQNTDSLFKRQTRREQNANLWSVIEKRIGVQEKTALMNWKPFALLGAILIGYKFFEMLSARNLALTIVPLIAVVALFVFLKENPFKISAELGLER